MFISYGANSTSKPAPRPTYSSSGTSSTVSQKHPQTEHCYGQHRANRSRHAVQQQQGNGRRRTCSFWPLPASDVKHYVSQNDDYQPSSSRWWDIPVHVHDQNWHDNASGGAASFNTVTHNRLFQASEVVALAKSVKTLLYMPSRYIHTATTFCMVIRLICRLKHTNLSQFILGKVYNRFAHTCMER